MSIKTPDTDKEVVGIFEWMLTIPFMLVPILNIIFAGLFIYFDKTSQTKRNFCVAMIFLEFIVFGIYPFL